MAGPNAFGGTGPGGRRLLTHPHAPRDAAMQRLRSLSPRLARLLASAAATLAVAAVPAAAQIPPPPPPPPPDAGVAMVTGQVLDAKTGLPIQGARVELGQQHVKRAVTDSQGRYTIRGVLNGIHPASARFLGYQADDQSITVPRSGMVELVFRLQPDPFVLEGITVTADRFAARRRAAAVASRALDRTHFQHAIAQDAAAAIRERAGLSITGCPAGRGECVVVRGAPTRVQVYVDEAISPTGLQALEVMDPQEIYMVEVYRGGAMIRVYTITFMEHAAKRGYLPEPLF